LPSKYIIIRPFITSSLSKDDNGPKWEIEKPWSQEKVERGASAEVTLEEIQDALS
jgi:hypothetical protein